MRIIGIAVATMLFAAPATQADFVTATRSNDHVLQGNFETGASDVFLQNNSNARRTGTGGAGGAQRVNQPVLGFTLPTLGAGESITGATLSFTMDTPSLNGAPLGFDMVISLMDQASVVEFSPADFLEGTAPVNSSLGNGIVIGQLTAADVADASVESFSLTDAALTQFAGLYDGAGNPLQSEVWFRLSTSATIDITDSANDNDRFNLARDDTGSGLLVTRSLEIITIPEPTTLGLLSVGALAFAIRRFRT